MFIFFFLMALAFADTTDVRSLSEKTYSRDNSYCQIGKEKIQIQIRSGLAFTEAKEKNYGDYFFYYPTEKPELLPLNLERFNSYRFFEGNKTLCSKSLGFALSKDLMAILFLQENRPEDDKLTIVLFNTKTVKPDKVIETEYQVTKAQAYKDGFAFATVEARQAIEMGKIKIKGEEFNYHDHAFPLWMKYTNSGFEILNDMTFEKFHWKSSFKDLKDFNEFTGWDQKQKKYLNKMFYLAINHALKKECILFLASKQKITGDEAGWHCH